MRRLLPTLPPPRAEYRLTNRGRDAITMAAITVVLIVWAVITIAGGTR